MGKIVVELLDLVVVSFDNFCIEDFERILQDILEGIFLEVKFLVISDCVEVICIVIMEVQFGDGVLIVGKGYEDY